MKQLILFLLFTFTSTLISQIKYVPTDYAIIQHAINDSKDGDTIIVKPGVYCQQINFKGKAITVASKFFLDGDTSHISRTIIDGMFLEDSDSLSLVYFVNGEDSTSVLTGFTLQHGKGTEKITDNSASSYHGGGGIFLSKSGATITDNIIKDNFITSLFCAVGGGIECIELPTDKSIIIKNNKFINNQLDGRVSTGGAIDLFLIWGSVKISQNRILKNKIQAKNSGYGGGICIYGGPNDDILIENNFISDNETISGYARGGGIAIQEANSTIRNNIIVGNNSQRSRLSGRGGGISVRFDYTVNDYIKLSPYAMKPVIENNTILFNKSSDGGSGISTTDASAEIINNIIRENRTVSGDQIFKEKYQLDANKIKLLVNYSNIEGGFTGKGNIDIEPNFCDSIYFCLTRDNSECIDAGNPSDKYFDAPDPDYIGRPKAPAYGTRINDMGAFGGPHSKWAEMGVITDVEDLVSTEIPNLPYLSQNYPNPFNPSTTIKYSIPQITHPFFPSREGKEQSDRGVSIKLAIYDILGSEIATLVNKNQKPGNYEVVWNASDLPSGVYFYELSYGAFIETKKLLLLK